ncbi:hypothetical protein [Vallitalea guaymasensis]|uniref:hypothetical protein n=1 Tax=Vallitalea guaymasensis TaxID=1185412 RepID=UPI000DE1F37C|nr:hypothetical protein [Vallitalea guaymasensis]
MDEVIDLFESSYNKYGDEIIAKRYKLSEGIYIRFNESNVNYFSLADLEANPKMYRWFAIREISSNVISTNKAVDVKKQIVSNNYLTLFTRSDKLNKTFMRINDYYDIFNDKNATRIKEYLIKNWEKFTLIIDPNQKVKVKFFYNTGVKTYKQQECKYLVNKVFMNKYNEMEGKGVPASFINMNAKKPYLEHKTRSCKAPTYVDSNRAIIIQKFKQFLESIVQQHKYIYILHDQDFMDNLATIYPEQPCYMVALGRDKRTGDCYIMDYESLPGEIYNPIKIENQLRSSEWSESEQKYITVEQIIFKTRTELEKYLDNIFSNKLIISYMENDIKINDNQLKNNIMKIQSACYNYFKKGEGEFANIIKRIDIDMVKYLLRMGYYRKAQNMMNLTLSYKEGEGVNEGR